jgi:hypothetical protein
MSTQSSSPARIENVPTASEMDQAFAAFRTELPKLLETHRGQWVAHHGHQRIGIASTADKLFRLGLELGLGEEEFLVSHIAPEIPDEEITWSRDV